MSGDFWRFFLWGLVTILAMMQVADTPTEGWNDQLNEAFLAGASFTAGVVSAIFACYYGFVYFRNEMDEVKKDV